MTGPARQSGSGPRRPVEPAQRLTPPPERASASPATAARSALATQPDDLPATLHPPSGMCIRVVDAPPIGRYARCVGSCTSITTASATDRGCDAEPANDGWLKDAGQTCHVRTTARSPGILRWPGRPRHSECHFRGGDISWRSVAYGVATGGCRRTKPSTVERLWAGSG